MNEAPPPPTPPTVASAPKGPARPLIPVTIRPVRLRDVPTLVGLYRGQPESSRALYHPFPFDPVRLTMIFTYQAVTRPFLKLMMRSRHIRAAALLVATTPTERRPIGYGHVQILHPAPGEVRAFFGYLVAPAYRGQRVGVALHDEMVETALRLGIRRGGGIILSQNRQNVRLLEKLGVELKESQVVDQRASPQEANFSVDMDLAEMQARRRAELAAAPAADGRANG